MKTIINIYTAIFVLIISFIGMLFCLRLIKKTEHATLNKPIIEVSSIIVVSSLLLLA